MNQRERLLYALILLLAGAALCYGWKLYWFLTDDAYISFRYVSNWALGHGPVWNPPPFRPVEGYTNFLWIVLLYGVWQVAGVAPPAAANYLALCFALCSLYIASQMLLRLPWSPGLRPYRLVFLASLAARGGHQSHLLGLEQFGLGNGAVWLHGLSLDLGLRVCCA